MAMQPTKLLIVIAPSGLIVRDRPAPEGKGAKALRTVPVGAQLYAYQIHYFDGVPYARLEPVNPQRPEWVRVAEADGGVKYVDVVELDDGDSIEALANSITLLANSITLLATNLREVVRGKSGL